MATLASAQESEPAEWRIAARPEVVLHSPYYPFFSVHAAVLFEDGSSAVANRHDPWVLFFDPAGRFVTERGGAGEGPGEFDRIHGMGLLGADSLWVFDNGLDRITLFDGDRRRAGVLVLTGHHRPARPVGFLADGRLVLHAVTEVAGRQPILIMDRSGDPTDSIVGLPGRPGRPQDVFRPPLLAAADGDRVYWADGRDFGVEVYDSRGELVTRANRRHEPYRLTGSRWRQHAEHRIERLRAPPGAPPGPDGRQASEWMRELARREYRQLDPPDQLPGIGEFVVAGNGDLWVGEYPLAGVRTPDWWVLSREGGWKARVALPEGARLLAVANDRAVLLLVDDDGVERVSVHSIEK